MSRNASTKVLITTDKHLGDRGRIEGTSVYVLKNCFALRGNPRRAKGSRQGLVDRSNSTHAGSIDKAPEGML